MNKYTVELRYKGHQVYEVQAENEAEAERIAEEQSPKTSDFPIFCYIDSATVIKHD